MTKTVQNSVVMCFDKAYGPAACVALTSLFLNSERTEFQVDLLQTDSDPDLDQALEKLAITFNRCINQHMVDERRLTGFHVSSHISSSAYLRFFIPDYVKSKKALYLDCDLIVQCDIGELFSIEFVNDELIAGVEDLTGGPYAKSRLGITDTYVNSGVMLIDIERWRNAQVSDHLIQYYQANAEKITWHDQCVINGALSGRKRLLDSNYNFLLHDIETGAIQDRSFSACSFKGIFHFNSTIKPWHRWCDRQYKLLWESYATVSPSAPTEIIEPRNLDEWHTLARYHEGAGEYQASSNIYRQLLAINQDNNSLEKHRGQCSERIAKFHCNTIKYGLMKGMRLSASGWNTQDKGAMILGLYEKEVSDTLATIDYQYNVLVDLGAADGIYGVGLLVNNRFEESYCFEASNINQELLISNASENGISEKVHVFGKADRNFHSLIPSDARKRAVVIVDIEGAEFDILSTDVFVAFSHSVFIIELHHWFFKDPSHQLNGLMKSAASTHSATFIRTGARDLSPFEELTDWSDNERWLLCSEGRARSMEWVRFDPISTGN